MDHDDVEEEGERLQHVVDAHGGGGELVDDGVDDDEEEDLDEGVAVEPEEACGGPARGVEEHDGNGERERGAAVDAELVVDEEELLCALPDGEIAALDEDVRELGERVDDE